MPGVDPHVLRIPWIEHEENWDDWLCQRWDWVQTIKGRLRCQNSFLGHSSLNELGHVIHVRNTLLGVKDHTSGLLNFPFCFGMLSHV